LKKNLNPPKKKKNIYIIRLQSDNIVMSAEKINSVYFPFTELSADVHQLTASVDINISFNEIPCQLILSTLLGVGLVI